MTARNLFAGNNEVSIYDSLSMLDNKTEQALSWMLRPKEDQFLVMFPSVQQQSNTSNCGLLVIGFAYAATLDLRTVRGSSEGRTHQEFQKRGDRIQHRGKTV